jgi:hypothetical protein
VGIGQDSWLTRQRWLKRHEGARWWGAVVENSDHRRNIFLVGATYAGIASADAPLPDPKTIIDHDGAHAVGTDIAAGADGSVGPVGGGSRSRARLRGFKWQRRH